MDKLRNYEIPFIGLKNGKHEFNFKITQSFFELFDTEKEFDNAEITINVLLDKHSSFLEFNINCIGIVELICDITTEKFNYPIKENIKFLVKFGEEYNDSHEEIITIPHQDYAFNIAQLIYESVMLSIPMKKLSPNISDEDLALLEKYAPQVIEEEIEDEIIDPRWEMLKKLKN